MYTQLFKCVPTNDISFINASRREIRRRFLSHLRPDLLQKRVMSHSFLNKNASRRVHSAFHGYMGMRYSLKLLIHASDRRIQILPVVGSIVETDTNLRGIRIRQTFFIALIWLPVVSLCL